MRTFEEAGKLPEGCEVVGIEPFAVFLDKDQREYLVPLEDVPCSDKLKEVVIRDKVNTLLEEANDYEMVQRILSTLGPCFV